MTNWDFKDRPNLVPWPPVLLALAILSGFALDQLILLDVSRTPLSRFIGVMLISGALALDVWSSLTFRKAQTTILPHRGSEALATGGPFAYSRNPIYLGNLLILFGVGLFFGSVWHIALVLPLAVAITRLAISREEKHLETKFPRQWADYTSKVRRWI